MIMKITDEQLDKILNTQVNEEYFIFELGVQYVYHNAPKGIRYSAPYREYGKAFWDKIETNIQSVLCKDGKPKANIEELISGDIRSLTEAILSIVVATYEVTLAIAIPITALVMKKGISRFCAKTALVDSKPELINDILEKKSLKIKLPDVDDNK